MGLLDSIKNIYNKVDTAVGGYLPGGSTPSEVSASKTVTPSTSSQQQTGGSMGSGGTYDTSSGTYINSSGQGFSTATPPSSATIVGGGVSSSRSSGSSSSSGGSYNPSSGVYTNTSGQGFSTATAPPGATIVGQTQPSTSYQPYTLSSGQTVYYNPSSTDSFKSQTGHYQYDFFSTEGQKERLYNVWDTLKTALNPFDKTDVSANTGIKPLDATLEWTANHPYQTALLVASVPEAVGLAKYGYSVMKVGKAAEAVKTSEPVVKAVSSLAKDGEAFLKADTEAMAIPKALKALENGVNTKKVALMSQISKRLFTRGGLTFGGVTVMGIVGRLISGEYQQQGAQTDYDTFRTQAYSSIVKLQEAGMTDEADEMIQTVKDMKETVDGFTLLQAAIPGGKSRDLFKSQMNNIETDLNNIILQVDAKNKKDADEIASFNAKLKTGTPVSPSEAFKIAGLDPGGPAEQYLLTQQNIQNNQELLQDQQRIISKEARMTPEQIINDPEILAAVNNPANANSLLVQIFNNALSQVQRQRQLDEQRAYDEQQTAEQRAYNEQLIAEQRAYNEQQQNFIDATATENAGSSALVFGLLKSSGEVEFVDRDAASQAYFGKVFEELTPAQKKLLMLSKGK